MPTVNRVLVVEDDAAVRRVLQVFLENAGYDVLLASDGEEGLALFGERRPDAVIVDITLPKLSGREFCRLTEADRAERDCLLILASGSVDRADRDMARGDENVLVVQKPYGLAALGEALRSWGGRPGPHQSP